MFDDLVFVCVGWEVVQDFVGCVFGFVCVVGVVGGEVVVEGGVFDGD